MITQDIIEEHPINQPAPWVSNAVIAPKTDGSIRMTLNACNVNKAIISTNHPTPQHEDIKAKLTGCKWFSKIKPVQRELNVALNIFMSIESTSLIHDDLILATKTVSEHIQTIHRVMEVVS